MAREFFLQENVLTDNILILPEKGRKFEGGYIAMIKEYVFQTAWTDREIVKMFKKKKELISYLGTQYPEVELDFAGTCLE